MLFLYGRKDKKVLFFTRKRTNLSLVMSESRKKIVSIFVGATFFSPTFLYSDREIFPPFFPFIPIFFPCAKSRQQGRQDGEMYFMGIWLRRHPPRGLERSLSCMHTCVCGGGARRHIVTADRQEEGKEISSLLQAFH